MNRVYRRPACARSQQVAALAAGRCSSPACSGGGPSTVVQPADAPPPRRPTTTPARRRPTPTCRRSGSTCGRTSRQPNRCGGCHHEGGQSPMFARTDDVNLAYQAASPLVNLTNPSSRRMVLKVGGGHNCWVADPSACAGHHADVDPGLDRCRLRLDDRHYPDRAAGRRRPAAASSSRPTLRSSRR